MPETPVEEIFAEFEAGVVGTFRPAGLEVVEHAVRRRRRTRHTTLGALVLFVMAAPALLLAGRDGTPPVLGPSPTATPAASASPAPAYEHRPVRVPGFPTDAPPTMLFTDAEHGWALLARCADGQCEQALGATSDGGRSWRRIATPDLTRKRIEMYPLDGQTITLHLIDEKFLLTTDGGAHFSSHPLSKPPAQARLALAHRWNHGDYVVQCPNASGFDNDPSGIECPRQELVRLGSGPVRPQPAFGGTMRQPTTVRQGGDGRLWLLNMRDDERDVHIQVSSDGAKTWQQLPDLDVYSGPTPQLVLSPDGLQMRVITNDMEYRLLDGVWTGLELKLEGLMGPTVQALGNGGGLVISTSHDTSYRTPEGGLTVVPGLPGFDVIEQLTDGTLLAFGDGLWLSPGPGPDREWIKIY